MSSPESPPAWAGPFCAVILVAGAVASASAGYSIEEALYRDAEKAIPGFLHGYLTFGVLIAFAAAAFKEKYKTLVGSPLWAALGLLSPGLATYLYLIHEA